MFACHARFVPKDPADVGGGILGMLGGGEAQQQGIEALAEWLRAAG